MGFELGLLVNSLAEILDDQRNVSEFTLLQTLQQPPYELFAKQALDSHLGLFQTHFTLFHALYLLQQRWLTEGKGYLSISALKIGLLPGRQDMPLDKAENKLRAYYLDLTQLSDTNEQDVAHLLDAFWEKFGNVQQWAMPDTEQVNCALAWFGLSAQSQWCEVKSTYYRVVHQQHPDKGGDISVTQAATEHFGILKRYFKGLTKA